MNVYSIGRAGIHHFYVIANTTEDALAIGRAFGLLGEGDYFVEEVDPSHADQAINAEN